LSDSEFLPVWKKYPGVADTMIKAGMYLSRLGRKVPLFELLRELNSPHGDKERA
jgi:hypothetical protein